MTKYAYRSCGLVISSEIALPGLFPLGDEAKADVSVVRGVASAFEGGILFQGVNWQCSEQKFRLHIEGVASFLLTDGHQVIVESDPGCDPDAVVLFLCGTVLGILLHQRGRIVLHASAVLVGDRAMLFCGPAAIGKSTLAVALAGRGYPVICDDICALDVPENGRPMVFPDCRRSKLWTDAIGYMKLEAQMGGRVRQGLEKHYLDHTCRRYPGDGAVPLGSIYWLRDTRPGETSGLKKLNIADLALLVQRNAYRPRLVHGMRQEGLYMRAVAAMMPHISAFNFWRPRALDQLADVLDMLGDHWHHERD